MEEKRYLLHEGSFTDNTFQRFVFPWGNVRYNENIIIYGAGVVGRTFLRQIDKSQYCCIKAVCDRNYEKIIDLNVPVISLEQIRNFEFDKIVVAIESEIVAKEIIRELELNDIAREKIVWYDYRRKEMEKS